MTVVVNRVWVLKLGNTAGDVRASVSIEGGHIGRSVLEMDQKVMALDGGGTVSLGDAAALDQKTVVVKTMVQKVPPTMLFKVRHVIQGSAFDWVGDTEGAFTPGDDTAQVFATISFTRT